MSTPSVRAALMHAAITVAGLSSSRLNSPPQETLTSGFRNGLSFVYDRDGATLTARGVTSGYVESDSIGLANHWLLVGSNRDVEGHFCQTELHTCLGRGNIFDLNRFAPAY